MLKYFHHKENLVILTLFNNYTKSKPYQNSTEEKLYFNKKRNPTLINHCFWILSLIIIPFPPSTKPTFKRLKNFHRKSKASSHKKNNNSTISKNSLCKTSSLDKLKYRRNTKDLEKIVHKKKS